MEEWPKIPPTLSQIIRKDLSLPRVFSQSITLKVPIIVKPALWGNMFFLFEKCKTLVDAIESLIKHTTLLMVA